MRSIRDRYRLVLTGLLLVSPAMPGARRLIAQHASDAATVRIDSARHLVVITAGPWEIPPAPAGTQSEHAGHMEATPQRFAWPVDGWARGASLRLVTTGGTALPHSVLHHVELVNLGRRELLYPVAERLLAFGSETEDIRMPASVGIPMKAGMPMMMTIAWMNRTGAVIHDATVELTVEWSPTNLVPRPVSVLPVTMGVTTDEFEDSGIDLTPGRGTWSKDFLFPVTGHIVAAGGHLHDYGTGVALSDVSGTTVRHILTLTSMRDERGHVMAVQRVMPGLLSDGIRLQQGRVYRVTGTYQNPLGSTIPKGGMISLVLLYAPEHPDRWPPVNTADRLWQKDLADLSRSGGNPMDGMSGMDAAPHQGGPLAQCSCPSTVQRRFSRDSISEETPTPARPRPRLRLP
jgi:hypothetical protein